MKIVVIIMVLLSAVIGGIYLLRDAAPEFFHADFVGSEVCGSCHTADIFRIRQPLYRN